MNRIKLILCVVCFLITWSLFSYGQNPQFFVEGDPYIGITSYDGAVSNSLFQVVIVQDHGVELNVANWKLSVKLTDFIQAKDDGTVFPAEKISFIPVTTGGQGYSLPTVTRIGMPSPVSLQGLSEVYLVPNSNTPLYNNKEYYRLQLQFTLVVAGGAYLKNLFNKTDSWDKYYRVPLEFTLYDGNNNVIGTIKRTYEKLNVQRLTGAAPEENRYTIRVSTEASNGLLEFKTMADYVNGKSVAYSDGLSVSATTSYQVTVRSVSPRFSSVDGNTLPLDIVHLQLEGDTGNKYGRSLSSSPQIILEGLSTEGNIVDFDIIYSTGANDARLFNVIPDQYETSLMYEISPR